MTRAGLTAEVLRELLSYDPETGVFVRIKAGSGYLVGDEAGTINSEGYRNISVQGRLYRASRLAWLYMTGQWPDDEIDHVNNDRSDERFVNLREATRSENNRNKGPQSNNTSGRKGVYWQRAARKWHVSVRCQGVRHYVGLFDDKEEATAAYDEKVVELHGAFARPNSEWGQAANNSGAA